MTALVVLCFVLVPLGLVACAGTIWLMRADTPRSIPTREMYDSRHPLP